MNTKFSPQNGFTLIEIVMVLVLLGFIASIAASKYFDMQEKAAATACAANRDALRAGVLHAWADKTLNGTAVNEQMMKNIFAAIEKPVCPSKGTYSITVATDNPNNFTISCSVHTSDGIGSAATGTAAMIANMPVLMDILAHAVYTQGGDINKYANIMDGIAAVNNPTSAIAAVWQSVLDAGIDPSAVDTTVTDWRYVRNNAQGYDYQAPGRQQFIWTTESLQKPAGQTATRNYTYAIVYEVDKNGNASYTVKKAPINSYTPSGGKTYQYMNVTLDTNNGDAGTVKCASLEEAKAALADKLSGLTPLYR